MAACWRAGGDCSRSQWVVLEVMEVVELFWLSVQLPKKVLPPENLGMRQPAQTFFTWWTDTASVLTPPSLGHLAKLLLTLIKLFAE
eukprot:scaffold145_cov195-Alexandrium_tamarense.AAC.105